MSLLSVRAHALASNAPYYHTGKICKHGHIAKRRTEKGSCVQCDTMHANIKNRKTIKQARNDNNTTFWPVKPCRNGHFSIRRTSKNACKACDKMNAHLRRAIELRAIPAWENPKSIKKLYEYTPGYALDHIIPLKGKTVCGLHCSDNLVKIPTKINAAKSNKWNAALHAFLTQQGLATEIIAYMKLHEAW